MALTDIKTAVLTVIPNSCHTKYKGTQTDEQVPKNHEVDAHRDIREGEKIKHDFKHRGKQAIYL